MRSKDYLINIKPIRWARAGLNNNRFFDTQTQEKLAYGLYIINSHGNEPPFQGPLLVDVTFFMTIPKLKRKRGASLYHATTPDIDNCVKMLLDSINKTNIVWEDDRQVAHLIARKIYDPKPRVQFTIRELS